MGSDSRGFGPGSGGVVLCLCEVRVWILCVDGLLASARAT